MRPPSKRRLQVRPDVEQGASSTWKWVRLWLVLFGTWILFYVLRVDVRLRTNAGSATGWVSVESGLAWELLGGPNPILTYRQVARVDAVEGGDAQTRVFTDFAPGVFSRLEEAAVRTGEAASHRATGAPADRRRPVRRLLCRLGYAGLLRPVVYDFDVLP